MRDTDPDISQVLSIDLDQLPSYAPAYPADYTPGVLNTDNTPAGNPVTDIGATLCLNLSEAQIASLVAFLHTLTDETLRTDPKFSDPFIRD